MFTQPAYQWADSAWRRSAEFWISESVTRRGGALIGPVAGVRFLPWSAVLRAPTDAGDVYFKACGPSQRHEPSLAALLAAAQPDCMIPILAVDPARGFLLMPDGGPTLTAALHSPADGPNHWRRVLSLLARVQRDLLPHAADLLALGVPDRRPAALPDLFAALMTRPERLLAGEPDALSAADVARLEALVPRVAALCAELAALGLPDTYVHDDLHEDHIFAHRAPDGAWRYVFFDYGDACLTHPFMQLVSQPRFVAGRFETQGDMALSLLHEEYLTSWGDFAPLPALRRALSIALALGGIIRALTWINACYDHLGELPAPLRHAYAGRVAFWLLGVAQRIEALDED